MLEVNGRVKITIFWKEGNETGHTSKTNKRAVSKEIGSSH